MYFEIAGFIALILLVFFTFASFFKLPPLGVIATVLLFLFGIGLIIDGIQLKSGELDKITTTQNQIVNGTSTNITITTVQNDSFVYSNPPATPFINYNYIIGFILICLSIYSGMYYVLQATD